MPVLSVQMMEVASALSNFSSPSPVLNMTMRLDARGHLAVANAIIVSNASQTLESGAETESGGGVAGALKGLFGGKKEEGDDAKASEEVETPKNETKPEKVVVKFKERALGVRAMTGEEKRTTMAR